MGVGDCLRDTFTDIFSKAKAQTAVEPKLVCMYVYVYVCGPIGRGRARAASARYNYITNHYVTYLHWSIDR